jgi:hypothetical protein
MYKNFACVQSDHKLKYSSKAFNLLFRLHVGKQIALQQWLSAQVFVHRCSMWFPPEMRHTSHLNAASSHTLHYTSSSTLTAVSRTLSCSSVKNCGRKFMFFLCHNSQRNCETESAVIIIMVSHLDGVMVSMLATGPQGRGFKPSRGDGFLKAIKIRSTSSFGWEAKSVTPCRKILRHVKNPLTYLRY